MQIDGVNQVSVQNEPPLDQRGILLYSGSTLILHSQAFFFLLFPWLSNNNFLLIPAVTIFIACDFMGVRRIALATRLQTKKTNVAWTLLAAFGLVQIPLAVWLSILKPPFGKDLAWLIGLLSSAGISLAFGIIFAFSAGMTRRIAYVMDIAHDYKSTGLSQRFPRRLVGLFFTVVGSLCIWIIIRETVRLLSTR